MADSHGRARPPVRPRPAPQAEEILPVVLPPKPLDEEMKELWLSGRTLVTDRPEGLDDDDISWSFR
ncbi:MAG: hypothetical protein ACLQOO_01265 [Terriglobia bacterium]